jgi:serine/threonine-protein kinase haspin
MRGPLRRTYGKKTAGKAAVAAVFGVANESSPLLQGQQSSRLSSGSRQASLRDPLVDITSVVENLTVAEISESADAGILATAAVENDSVADNLTTANASELSKVSGLPSVVQNDPASIYNDESATTTHRAGDVPHNFGYLKELFAAYQLDRGHTLPVKSWDEITEGDLSIVKIAEASYAEVYRVTTKYGTSILKVMQLKIPSDPPSMDSYTTVGVKSIMAEIRITNAMTEIPGFVSFRDVHLVQGKPNTAISDAWKAYLLQFTDSTPDIPTSNSYFPDPDSYADQSVFLVIELGDAGEVLQHFRVDTRHKVFDIFLGTALVLSRAEQESDFEVITFL